MSGSSTIITEHDYAAFVDVIEQIGREANAKFVFLLDRAGQKIASAGELGDVDPTALASLTAGNVAATEGVAQLVGEDTFSTLFHEGKHDNIHISVVDKVILLVVFDERSSIGLVRLRVGQHVPTLGEVVSNMGGPREGEEGADSASLSPLADITEDDIDALFG